MEDNLLKVENAGFYYLKDRFCFKNLFFSLKKSETLAILGLNGQGKSTLMFCMMGVLKLKEGKLYTNANFAFLPQNFSVAFDYSVLDIVIMGRVRKISFFSKPSKNDIQIAYNALELLQISHLAKRSFNALSGGQKQLVLFARAIGSDSEILFLDEPASALDIKNQEKVLNLISSLKKQNQKTSIVFTTHQPNHALAVADKTLILKSDLNYIFGKSHEVLSDENLTSLYDVDIRSVNIPYKNTCIKSITWLFNTQKNI